MDAIRESVTLTSKILDKKVKCSVEAGIIVPDKNPDVLKILQADAVSAVRKVSVQNEKILVEGTVYVTVLYLPECVNDGIKSISNSFSFNDVIDASGIDDDARCIVTSDIEQVDIKLLNSRKLNIHTIVGMRANVNADRQISYISGLEGNDAACRYTNKNINYIKACEMSDFLIKETIELQHGKPQISSILKCDMRIEDKEARCVTNKVILKGSVCANVLYVSTTGTIEQADAVMPFTDVIELNDNCEEEYINSRCDIIESNVKCEFDSDGEKRQIKFELLISAVITVNGEKCISYISDCYYYRYKTVLDSEELVAKQTKLCPAVTQNVRECIPFDKRLPAPASVYNVVVCPVVTDIDMNAGKANIKTRLDVSVLYLSEDNDNPVCCMKSEIPVSYMYNYSDDCNVCAKADCEHISYSINSNGELELRAIIGYDIEETTDVKIKLLNNIEKGEEISNSEIVILTTKNDEDIWNLGKKYCVDINEIIALNKLEEADKIPAGCKILIPCL